MSVDYLLRSKVLAATSYVTHTTARSRSARKFSDSEAEVQEATGRFAAKGIKGVRIKAKAIKVRALKVKTTRIEINLGGPCKSRRRTTVAPSQPHQKPSGLQPRPPRSPKPLSWFSRGGTSTGTAAARSRPGTSIQQPGTSIPVTMHSSMRGR